MAAETRKSRKGNFSQEEIDVLVTTVLQNHDLLYGETSKSFFHKEIRNQVWNIILEEVNKVSMERRTLTEVKNKWKKCQHSIKTTDVPESLDDVDCDDLVKRGLVTIGHNQSKCQINNNLSKMKTKKHRNRNMPNPVARGFPAGYEPSFKRSVILYAEQKSNQEARKRFGISEETIRRWRKLRQDIMEKAQQCIRRSQRHTMGPGSFCESSLPFGKKEKERSIEKERFSEESMEEDPKKDLDSMPLQQRLSQNHNEPLSQPQETVLQSLPISPTKLKVTRQGKPQQLPPRAPTPPPPAPPQVCLKWNSHHTNMQSAFPNLLTREQYVDATLVSEGKTLKCHRMILSSCSPYFEEVLSGIGPFQHPVLFMKDIPFWVLKALCDFMYAGEVHILQDKLQELLDVATTLKIKGLAGSPDSNQDLKPVMPEIKQEIDAISPPRVIEPFVKEEKEEEPPPLHPRLARHDVAKPSKKKEDRRSKHAAQTPREKEKVVEEPPKVASKVAPKIVAKVVIPKLPVASKTTVKNVLKNVVKAAPKSSTSRSAHASRKNESSRKSEKHKVEATFPKEDKEKEKSLKKDNINDPLDLLQPVYEEIAKEDPPLLAPKTVNPSKLREKGNVQVKRGVNKKVKKRRYAEYAEDREESPPPLFHSRKGTRSRPNVKIPKYFHTHYDDSPKESGDATIVREPHTDQNDPLIGVEVEEIKAEPLDVEENAIEMEDSLVNFMVQDQEGEEIIGNYDSPLVNIKIEPKRSTPIIFKKELDPQPVIMDVHTVAESNVRLLDIKEENVQIVDISAISTGVSRMEDPGSYPEIEPPHANASDIIISSVQSMAELPREGDLDLKEEAAKSRLVDEEMQEKCSETEPECDKSEKIPLKSYAGVGIRPLETLTAKSSVFSADPLAQSAELHLEHPTASVECEDTLTVNIKIENIKTEKLDDAQLSETGDLKENQEGNLGNDENVLIASEALAVEGSKESGSLDSSRLNADKQTQEGSLGSPAERALDVEMSQNQSQGASSSLGGLEGKIDALALNSEGYLPPDYEALQETSGVASNEALTSKSVENAREELVVESANEMPTPSNNNTEDVINSSEDFALRPEISELDERENVGNNAGNIEAELEECLASTSNMVPPDLVEKAVFLEEDEDFTKDIEFDGKAKPANYLGIDFADDFGIKARENAETDVRNNGKQTQEHLGLDVEFRLEGGETDETDIGSPLLVPLPLASDDVKGYEFIEQNNVACEKTDNILDEVATADTPEHPQTSGQMAAGNFEASLPEDERRMEEKLLADLDDDIVMKGAATSREDAEGSEKTLEMIVNDLNESLGEMRK